MVCSAAWADAQFKTVKDRTADGIELRTRMHDRTLYPVSGMKECACCHVATPPNCVDGITGICLDCHISGAFRLYRRWQPEKTKDGRQVVTLALGPVIEGSIPHLLNEAWGRSPSAESIRIAELYNLRFHNGKLIQNKGKS